MYIGLAGMEKLWDPVITGHDSVECATFVLLKDVIVIYLWMQGGSV